MCLYVSAHTTTRRSIYRTFLSGTNQRSRSWLDVLPTLRVHSGGRFSRCILWIRLIFFRTNLEAGNSALLDGLRGTT